MQHVYLPRLGAGGVLTHQSLWRDLCLRFDVNLEADSKEKMILRVHQPREIVVQNAHF